MYLMLTRLEFFWRVRGGVFGVACKVGRGLREAVGQLLMSPTQGNGLEDTSFLELQSARDDDKMADVDRGGFLP